MAVEFKSSMSKNELLEIAAEHGIEADDSMKKNDILKRLEQARAAEGAQEPQDGAETPPEGNDPAEGDEATQEPQDGEESTTGNSNTEPPAEDAQEAAPEGYGLFVYAGPSLPHGRLKEHAVSDDPQGFDQLAELFLQEKVDVGAELVDISRY